MSPGLLERRLAAVMFTDMVGYTALIQADESLGLDKRERYWSALESGHAACGGTIVQRLGDGSMSMFPSALGAVEAAVSIQRELISAEVPARIGIHVGEVIVEPERLSGEAVNIASRIESFSGGWRRHVVRFGVRPDQEPCQAGRPTRGAVPVKKRRTSV